MPTTEQHTELQQLARRVETFQREQKWSDTRLAREVPQIVSTKPYRNILKGVFAELNIENQLARYRAALKRIEALRTKVKIEEPEYRSFQNITESLSAIEDALLEDSLARFVPIVGESGTGKSTVRNIVVADHKQITMSFDAHDHWNGSLQCSSNAAIAAYNTTRSGAIKAHPQRPTISVDNLIAGIGGQQLILFIDEAHHLGPRGLNMLKSLINSCPRLVVVAPFIPYLLKQLLRNNFEECRQLFLNRMCQRVDLPSPPAEEIQQLLEARGVRLPENCDAWMENLALESKSYGNWRFINKFCRAARAGEKRTMTADDFTTARDIARAAFVPNQQN